MDLSRWKQIEELYHAAQDRLPAERAAFLSQVDPGLRREVESLLAQPSKDDLLDHPAWENLDATRTQLYSGSKLGPYHIRNKIGEGGMGAVYRAHDPRLGRDVAIKVAASQFSGRFEREARAVAALNHPNICTLYDVGFNFLVMELVEGETLAARLQKGKLSIEETVGYGAQVADALAAAHAKGIIHRDLKPANIMLTPNQQVKVLDFGVSKITSPIAGCSKDETLTIVDATLPGMAVGTVSYMPPEQTRGESVDCRADIFSLGCVLYQAATGRLPFRGASTLAVMHEIATATPAAPSSLCAQLPAAFDRLIAGCLEKNPRQRPASATEVAGELKRLVSPPNRGPARMGTDRPSVAVIPFQLRTLTQEDQFLSVALADAVIHRLATTGKLLVRPIASTIRYKGLEAEWAQVARELNVDLVVEGTIQKSGAKVRVLLEVHRVSDARTLHSAKYDGDAEDLFGLQDRVADSVSHVLVPREKQILAQPVVPPTKNPLAYELYMRAVDRLAHCNKFDISSAIEILNRVVELDPDFAEAWGRLAQAYAQTGMHFDPDPQWFERAECAIARTLELDPVQCDALCARGFILWSPSRGFQNQPALRAINASLKINPSRYVARQFRCAILFHLGFYQESECDAEESLLANPGYALAIQNLGMIAHYQGNYTAAHEFNERALDLDPALILANIMAPLSPLFLGRIEEAREKIRRVRPMVPEEPQITSIEGLIAAHEGNFKRAEQLADEACTENRKSVTHTHHTWHLCAGVYAMCGRPDKAIFQLRRCATMGLPNYHLFGSDPHLRALQDRPEFTALLSDLRRQHDRYRVEIDLAGGVQPE